MNFPYFCCAGFTVSAVFVLCIYITPALRTEAENKQTKTLLLMPSLQILKLKSHLTVGQIQGCHTKGHQSIPLFSHK